MEIKLVEKRFPGYREIPSNTSDDFSHAIYDKEAHFTTQGKIKSLESQIRALKQEQERELSRIQTKANQQIEEMREQVQETLSNMEQEIAVHAEQAEYYKNLNKNLIKVATERANAKKGMHPRKERSGYLHLGMEQAQYHYKDITVKKSDVVKLSCWRIRLQSPYSILMDYKSISRLIHQDIMEKFLPVLQVDHILKNHKIEIASYDSLMKVWQENTVIFKSYFKANTNQGFWEIELWSNCALPIPSEFLLDNLN